MKETRERDFNLLSFNLDRSSRTKCFKVLENEENRNIPGKESFNDFVKFSAINGASLRYKYTRDLPLANCNNFCYSDDYLSPKIPNDEA